MNRTSYLPRNIVILSGIVLIAIATVRIVRTYRVFNQTFDEPTSVACGMEWLELGSYDYDPKHPPLGRIASAIGLYLDGVRSSGEIVEHPEAEGNALLLAGGHYWRNLALARLGLLPFFVLACIIAWVWGTWVWGPPSGLLAVGLFSTVPPVLGHAGVAMTDIVLTATLPAALFCLCLWLESPSRRRSLALGACLALAILSKLTALIFLPACAIPLCLAYVLHARSRRIALKLVPRAQGLALASLVVVLLIGAGYQFSLSPMRMESLRPGLDRLAGGSVAVHDAVYRALDAPVPAGAFLRGIDELWSHNEESHPNYFLGQRRAGGWWYYYPIVIAVKTPLPFLLLVLLGIVFIVRESSRNAPWRAWTLPGPVAGIFAVGIFNHVNIGVRHILPIYVMLAAIAGYGALRLFKASRVGAAACMLLLLWQAVSSAFAHPDYLAYFNELSPGETGTFGVDSDLDWGQDLARLHDACVRRHVDSLALIYNGTANPNWFDLPRLRRLVPGTFETGWVAISINTLKLGLPEQPEGYLWLEHYKPVEVVGKSIRLYFVPPYTKKV